MKKIWDAILRFFGFGDDIQTPAEKAKELMAWISSKDRMDQCTQQAFQAVQKREPLPLMNAHIHMKQQLKQIALRLMQQ